MCFNTPTALFAIYSNILYVSSMNMKDEFQISCDANLSKTNSLVLMWFANVRSPAA